MNPFAAAAVKTIGAAGVSVLLSAGAVSASSAKPPAVHSDRNAVRAAVIESEADVLGITPQTLVKDLKAGQRVSDLAKDRGITQEQFETRLVADLRPRLETLVDKKVITQAQADRLLDRIAKGHIPFWNGIHAHQK